MARKRTTEWRGRTDDARPPWYVVERLLEAADHRCQGPCGQPVGPGNPFDVDHIVELRDGGENRESNLQILCRKVCHRTKTAVRHSERGAERRTRQHLSGWTTSKHIVPGSKASPWKKKLNGEVVLRRPVTFNDGKD